jgi:hypothetical protein
MVSQVKRKLRAVGARIRSLRGIARRSARAVLGTYVQPNFVLFLFEDTPSPLISLLHSALRIKSGAALSAHFPRHNAFNMSASPRRQLFTIYSSQHPTFEGSMNSELTKTSSTVTR